MVKMDQLAHSLWDRILLIRRLFGRFCLCVLPVNLNLDAIRNWDVAYFA